jgi:hypothetical protein
MSAAVRPHNYTPSWLVQGNFTFTSFVLVMRVYVYVKNQVDVELAFSLTCN